MSKLLFFLFLLLTIVVQAQIDSTIVSFHQDDTLALDKYSKIVVKFGKESKFDSVFYHANKILPIAEKHAYREASISIFYNLGRSYFDKRDRPNAILYAKKAMDSSSKLNNTMLIKSYDLLARIYDVIGEEEKSIALSDSLLSNTGLINNAAFKNIVYRNLSVLAYKRKDYKKMLEYCLARIEQFAKIEGQLHYHSESYNLLGVAYRHLEDDRAEAAYLKGNKLIEENNKSYYFPQYYTNTGDWYLFKKNYKLAKDYFLKAEKFAKKHNQKNFFYVAQMNLGEVHMAQQNHHQARYIFEHCLVQFKKLKETGSLYLIHKNLALVYERIGDFKKANQHLKEVFEHDKKIFDLEKKSNVSELEIKYKIQQKELELKQQKALNKIQTGKLEIQQWLNLALGLFLITAIFLLVGAAYSIKKRMRCITLLKAKNTIIKQQSIKLKVANDLKAKVFALLSHDLRSPIGQLSNQLKIAHSSTPSLQPLQKEFKRVQLLLDNLLYWASGQIKNHASSMELVAIRLLIESAVAQYEQEAKEKQIQVLLDIGKEQALVNANELLLVLRNLLSNAIKFSVVNSSILIKTKILEENGLLELSVHDVGIGMDEAELKNIFLFPLSKQGTNEEQGTGLGLGLSKGLVEKWGGKLQIQSKKNEGTNVRLLLRTSI